MSTPHASDGEKQKAGAQVQMAVKLLETALGGFGSHSDEGQAVLNSIKTLSSQFHLKKEKNEGLIPSEIMNLVSSLPKGAGGMPPPGAGAPPPGGMPAPPGAAPPGMPPPPMQ
jgi:hypothetical protein